MPQVVTANWGRWKPSADGVVYSNYPNGDKGGVPSWAANATSGNWVSIPSSNTLNGIDPESSGATNQNFPSAANYHGSGGLAAMFTAWGGGCFDEINGNFWFLLNGGHGDYYGNGRFKWALKQAAPAFSMVKAPSDLVLANYTADGTGFLSDGEPKSTHTYNVAVYVPGVGPFMIGNPAINGGADGTRQPLKFNESTGAFTALTAPTTSGVSGEAAACFDPSRGTQGSIWYRHGGSNIFQRYDVAANSWTNTSALNAYDSSAISFARHPGSDTLLVGLGGTLASSATPWSVYDLAADTYHTPTFSGSVSGGLLAGECQPVWVPSLGCFCAWNNVSSPTLITTLTPGANPRTNTWTIGSLPVTGGVTPSTTPTNGTFGRFRYWPDAGGFVLINAVTEAGYFYKI